MRKAFTIIELLIVIAVIAILIGIALPRFKGMQDEGNIARAKSELSTLQVAIESYYLHNSNTYPTALSNLTAATTIPNIVSVLPTDPFTSGSNYGYLISANGRYYVVWSAGPSENGSVSALSDTGTVTETNGGSCIYITNGTSKDTAP